MTIKINLKDEPEKSRGITPPFPCADECEGISNFIETYNFLKEEALKSVGIPEERFGKMVVFGTGGDHSKEFKEWKDLQEK